jgi:hypothetical protein
VADPFLVHRAEQAFLGALVARQGRVGAGTALVGDAGPGGLAGLRPQDFADPRHQAIYAALAGQALPERRGLPGLYERLRAFMSRLLSAQARDTAAYMAGLPGLCPDSANLPAYTAMVTEASQARAVPAPTVPAAAVPAPTVPAPTVPAAAVPVPQATHAPQRPAAENPRLASAGQWLDGARQAGTRQATQAYTAPPSQTGRALDGLDRQTARLARALSADARRLADRAVPQAAVVPVPPESQPATLNGNSLLNALQEQMLADLMLHPASRGDVTSWLPARVFSAGHNRTLYQLISLRLNGGRPVDPLIIAWDASTLAGTAGSGTAQGESLAAAALRLGASNPAPGIVAVLAQPLYAEHVCTQAFGPGWREGPRPVPVPPVASAAPASQAQAAAPSAAEQSPSAARQPSSPVAPAPKAASRPEPAPAAAGRQVPAPPRLAPGLPLRPPLPDVAEPGPVPRR